MPGLNNPENLGGELSDRKEELYEIFANRLAADFPACTEDIIELDESGLDVDERLDRLDDLTNLMYKMKSNASQTINPEITSHWSNPELILEESYITDEDMRRRASIVGRISLLASVGFMASAAVQSMNGDYQQALAATGMSAVALVTGISFAKD